MNKKKITIYVLVSLLMIQFIYTSIYIILAYNGSVQKLKLRMGSGYNADLTVPVWAPYGFINKDMEMNNFLYFIYAPFYDLNRYIYSEPVEENE